jgi:dipeptidase E
MTLPNEHMTGDERMVLSGGVINRRFFEAAIELTGKDSPLIVIDQSATPDQERFNEKRLLLTNFLARQFGLNPEWLQRSFDKKHSPSDETSLLADADILYVGGGNTRRIHETWSHSFAQQVKQATREGRLVATGASAGALLWFRQAHSDSRQYEVPEGERWNYIRIAGNDVLNAWATVHYSDSDAFGRKRRKAFKTTLASHRIGWETAVGLDSGAALLCVNGLVSALSLQPEARPVPTLHVYRNEGPLHPEHMKPGKRFRL